MIGSETLSTDEKNRAGARKTRPDAKPRDARSFNTFGVNTNNTMADIVMRPDHWGGRAMETKQMAATPL
jgi:hypothetical protein